MKKPAHLVRQITLAAVFGLCASQWAVGSVPASVAVNDTGDADADDSVCTLREAITAANSMASYHGCVVVGDATPVTITFAIPGTGVHEIDVGSQLPGIGVPVILDGLSQSGADCTQWPPTLVVQISSPTNGQYNGLTLNPGSGGSVVRGLVINGFNNNVGYAFNFNAAINIYQSNGNHVECSFLGTNASGTTAVPNLRAVDINSASNNVIGSDGTAKSYFTRNVISGNSFGQVDTRGNELTGNRISGNFIGTDVTGTLAIGGNIGVDIGSNPGPAHENYVGWDGVGDPVLMRNIISGFTGSSNSGVMMEVGAQHNFVSGNYIGTDVTGTQAIPNFIGVELGSNSSVYNNIIGGDGTIDAASARNVISGNSFGGVDINAANGTHDNAVIGNYVGVDATGTALLANGNYGVSMDFAANTLVADNWIAGSGIAIRFFGSGSFGGGTTASFINNAAASNPALPALDSSNNCVLGSVSVNPQGANVPNPNLFANNWWGAPTGPNTAGASSADGSINATPFLTQPATVCSDVIFRDGFDGS